MTLKAILFDFNGVIINDEPIHQELIDEILLGENLRPCNTLEKESCIGKSDQAGLSEILSSRGRVVSQTYLDQLIEKKTIAYRKKLEELENLPIYPEIQDFLPKIQEKGLSMAIVTGSSRDGVEYILHRIGIADYFSVIVTAEDIKSSKPNPEGYLLAVTRLNQKNHNLQLQAKNCLVIEDSYPGIEAAKRASMQVVGIANTYPFHMIQRQADWVVDYLKEIELERIEKFLETL